MTALKLINGIVSPVCQIEGSFLIYDWKQCHGCSREPSPWRRIFRAPRTLLKWMDLRVSPILYTVFEHCDIQNLSDCTEMFVQFAKLKAFFYLRMEKCHRCSQEPSPWRRFFWAPRASSVKIDGFEGFSNITHADLCDI